MSDTVVKCAGHCQPTDNWSLRPPCSRNGTLEYKGKMWCKTHHPPTIGERNKAQHVKQDKRNEAWLVAHKREAAIKEITALLIDAAKRWRVKGNPHTQQILTDAIDALIMVEEAGK